MLNFSSVDRGAVVTKFVDFCGGPMGFFYGFMKIAYYGLVQDLSVDSGIERKFVDYLKRKVFVEEKKGNCN